MAISICKWEMADTVHSMHAWQMVRRCRSSMAVGRSGEPSMEAGATSLVARIYLRFLTVAVLLQTTCKTCAGGLSRRTFVYPPATPTPQ